MNWRFQGSDNEKLNSFIIAADMAEIKLSTLKMNKAPGIDQISSRMLIELSEEIFNMVDELFNKSLSTCNIPQDWKLANVAAVLKNWKKPVHETIVGEFYYEFMQNARIRFER